MRLAIQRGLLLTALAGLLLFRTGSVAPVKELLRQALPVPQDVDAQGEYGRTALLAATLQQNPDEVKRLLDAGANVDVADQSGLTPLMAAAMAGDADLLRLLVPRSKKVDATEYLEGRSAIHFAVAARHYDCAEILLPHMQRLDLPCRDGRTLLTMACDNADGFVETVLDRVSESLEWTADTRRALDSALASGNKDLIRLLLRKHPASPTLEGRAVPLVAHAIVNNDIATFQALLDGGADPNAILPTPFDKQFVSALPSKYLRHYITGDDGISVLMLAAGLGKPDYVRALLEAGADRNLRVGRHKMIALYFAARTDNWKCQQLLLGGGPGPEQLRVEISLASQRVEVIKNGVPVFKTECSTGRQGFTTRAGEYVITDKNRDHRSTIYKVPMPYFMRLSCSDFGMHEGFVPNYPASHGCIRLPSEAARKFFSEIPVGTLVTIN